MVPPGFLALHAFPLWRSSSSSCVGTLPGVGGVRGAGRAGEVNLQVWPFPLGPPRGPGVASGTPQSLLAPAPANFIITMEMGSRRWGWSQGTVLLGAGRKGPGDGDFVQVCCLVHLL